MKFVTSFAAAMYTRLSISEVGLARSMVPGLLVFFIAGCAGLPASMQMGELTVYMDDALYKDRGSRAGFKFFVQIEGCPNLIKDVANPEYLGMVRFGKSVVTDGHKLAIPVGERIFVYQIKPSDTPQIMAGGGTRWLLPRTATFRLEKEHGTVVIGAGEETSLVILDSEEVIVDTATDCKDAAEEAAGTG